MNKTFYGAVMGLLIGTPAVLFAWVTLKSAQQVGSSVLLLWVVAWIIWGAILGRILPKHK